MKKIYRLMALIMLLGTISAAAYAVDVQKVAPPATPPAQDAGMGMQHGMGMHHGMGMGGMMAGMTDEEKDKHMRGMQEHMLKMHDLSNQILAEKDPTQKEQLKTEQLKLMKAHHEEHHAKMMEHRKEMRNTSPK
jgi:hypothetical protein